MTSYHCPRCQNTKIIEYTKTIECPKCRLEFDKKDLETFKDDQILSLEEKESFIKYFKLD